MGGDSAAGDHLPGAKVLDTFVHALDWGQTRGLVARWIGGGESRYVCLCNVHSVVSAQGDPEYAEVLDRADLVLPDGMPVAWALRRRGFAGQPRISGPDLMWHCCEDLARDGEALFLYGSTRETLDRLADNLRAAFPALKIAGAISPPFRELTPEETDGVIEQVNGSGAHALFVALGCPRQEAWMARHRGRISAVMFGFGAAFDFHAGTVKRAPAWMQRSGLEWLHRLAAEPLRLWKRYIYTNAKFMYSMLLSSGRGG
jgi:N-acetylglucosaminyldiphosphoundecaprenol N-acetyl-beta-D-mannosaminyltransferase